MVYKHLSDYIDYYYNIILFKTGICGVMVSVLA